MMKDCSGDFMLRVDVLDELGTIGLLYLGRLRVGIVEITGVMGLCTVFLWI